MGLSEPKHFAPNGARIKLLTVVVYKHLASNRAKTTRHLAPNGAKATSSKNTDRFVAWPLETPH